MNGEVLCRELGVGGIEQCVTNTSVVLAERDEMAA